MSTRLELIITGDSRDATQAIEALQRSGAQAASILEREFDQLGTHSTLVFENKRKIATEAYERIKKSGIATADELIRAEKAYAAQIKELDRAQHGVEESTISLSSAYGQLASALAAIGVGVFISKMTEAKVAIDRIDASLKTTFGRGAAGEFDFVAREADRLGLALTSAAGSYGKIAAASKGTILEGEKTRAIFSGVTEAATALGLSAYDTEGILNALQQMISKGNVQAEELRGQLGERLPGAFGLAAQAMGVTEQQLNKMLERGEVLASDLLPKLAAALHEKYGKAAEEAAGKMQGALNEAGNAWDALLRKSGDSLPMIGTVNLTTEALKLLTEHLDDVTVGLGVMAASATTMTIVANIGAITTAIRALAASTAVATGGMSLLMGVGAVALYEAGTLAVDALTETEQAAANAADAMQTMSSHTNTAATITKVLADAQEDAKKKQEAHAKAVKAAEGQLERYSRSLNDLGREQLRLAESGFSRDMQLQADYFNRTATAAGNLTAPIRSYLAVIDQVYGAQKRGQEAVLATMVQIGASDAARLQQQINLGTVEKTMLESRRKAWETYAGDVEKLVATAWDNIAKKEETLLQSRLATQGMKDTLRDKIDPKQEIDPFTARLQQQDALRALEQKAMASANPAEQLRLLEQAQKGWAALDSEVKIGEDILISTDTAARQALDNVDRLGKAIDTLRQQEATQAAEALQDLVMAKGEAEAAITALDTALLALDTRIAGMTRRIAVTGEDKATPVVDDVKRALDTLKDKTITITANYVSNIPGRAGDASAATATQGAAEKSAAPVSPGKITGVTLSSSQPYSLPGRANGGPVSPFGTYVVGERGPEILQMGNQGGTVIPNEKIGGQSIQFGDININLPNVTNQSVVDGLVREVAPKLMRLMNERFRSTG